MFKIFFGLNLQCGISAKADGPMELASAGLGEAENRRRFYQRRNIDGSRVVSPRQSHSITAEAATLLNPRPEADAVFSSEPGLILTVTAADCFPVYFYDIKQRVAGLAHCGWRGVAGGLPSKTVRMMKSAPADVLAGIGPGIRACHFEVRDDVLGQFAGYPEAVIRRGRKIFIDLPKIVGTQLTKSGVAPANIEDCGECTYCLNYKYFSYRRDRPETVQAQLAYIARTGF